MRCTYPRKYEVEWKAMSLANLVHAKKKRWKYRCDIAQPTKQAGLSDNYWEVTFRKDFAIRAIVRRMEVLYSQRKLDLFFKFIQTDNALDGSWCSTTYTYRCEDFIVLQEFCNLYNVKSTYNVICTRITPIHIGIHTSICIYKRISYTYIYYIRILLCL